MKQDEIVLALRALAKKHPHAKNVGYMWKNPLNPKSKGKRWSPADLKKFRDLQLEYR
jgi:bifunctional pyridoxal-dependent enzyme with beta-cystathionase and maltose regulon repressor activities